jgi:hypothetical protein
MAYPVMTQEIAQYLGESHGHHQIRHGRFTQVYSIPLPATDNRYYPAVQRAKVRQKEAVRVARRRELIDQMARRKEPVVPIRDPLERFHGVMVPDPRNHYRAMHLSLPYWRI